MSASAVKLTDQRSDQALSATIEYLPSSTRRRATTLRVEAGYDISPRWTASASIGADVSTSDSTQALSRAIGVGLSHTLRGPLAFTISGSRGVTAAAPQWVVSVAIGTVFTGTSPVTPTTPLRQLKTAFVGGVNRGTGAGKTGCP